MLQVGRDRLSEAVGVFVQGYNAHPYKKYGTSISRDEAEAWALSWWPRAACTGIEYDGELVGCGFWLLAWMPGLSLRIPANYRDALDWPELLSDEPEAVVIGTKNAILKNRLSARQSVEAQRAIVGCSFEFARVFPGGVVVSGMEPAVLRLYRMLGVEAQIVGQLVDPRAPGHEVAAVVVRAENLPDNVRRFFPRKGEAA